MVQTDGQTDRQTESISECTLKDLSNDIWHAYQWWKLVGDEENNIPPPLHKEGGINVCYKDNQTKKPVFGTTPKNHEKCFIFS